MSSGALEAQRARMGGGGKQRISAPKPALASAAGPKFLGARGFPETLHVDLPLSVRHLHIAVFENLLADPWLGVVRGTATWKLNP